MKLPTNTCHAGLVSVDGSSIQQLADFTALSSQMALASPTGVQMGSYNPSNTPQACPAVATGSWEAVSSPLPPSPNKELCSCMFQTLSCTVNPNVNETDYGKLFGLVCGYGSSCAGIAANAKTGKYGAYSVCNATEQLSWAFSAYYHSQNGAADACSFGGNAQVVSGATAGGACSSLLSQAGSAGTGSVSSSATPGGSSGSSGHKSGAMSASHVDFPVLAVGLWISLAIAFGSSLVLV